MYKRYKYAIICVIATLFTMGILAYCVVGHITNSNPSIVSLTNSKSYMESGEQTYRVDFLPLRVAQSKSFIDIANYGMPFEVEVPYPWKYGKIFGQINNLPGGGPVSAIDIWPTLSQKTDAAIPFQQVVIEIRWFEVGAQTSLRQVTEKFISLASSASLFVEMSEVHISNAQVMKLNVSTPSQDFYKDTMYIMKLESGEIVMIDTYFQSEDAYATYRISADQILQSIHRIPNVE